MSEYKVTRLETTFPILQAHVFYTYREQRLSHKGLTLSAIHHI
jgi:hypothetical protein